ncbi:MAG: DNA polymerase III subunit beta [Clostridia bacterium]|nr:DNA polymerase III subunit beta [Clostridia bacterium]
MRIIFDRSTVIAAVTPLMCAVSNKNTLPAIEGILMRTVPGGIEMTTFDLEKGVRLFCSAEVLEEGYIILNAQKFYATIRAMGGRQIELVVDKNLGATILSGSSSYQMQAMRGEDFPGMPVLESERSFLLPQGILRALINQTAFAVAVNDQRAALNGCFFRVTEGQLLLVGCDSFRLAKCSADISIENLSADGRALDFSFIIPGKTLAELIRFLDDKTEGDELPEVRVYLTRKHVIFRFDELTLFSRIIDSEYLDYNRVLSGSDANHATLDRQELLGALERATLVTEEKVVGAVRSWVKLTFGGPKLEISSISSTGRIYDEVENYYYGEPIEIGFNNRYLIDTLRACTAERVTLSLTSPLMRMVVEPAEDEATLTDQVFMVVPVRMHD